MAAGAAVWPLALPPSKGLLPPDLKVPGWVVDRPAEMVSVVAAVMRDQGGTVGITTALYGAGGFGKTTLAQMVAADRQVRRRYRGRVYLVTVGRELRGQAAVAAKVNDVIKLISGEVTTFTDPELAGRHLGSLLNTGPYKLLVLDDVWESEQLAPFIEGGRKCARLVTTRVPTLLTGRGEAIRVDQMTLNQSRKLLTAGLPALDPKVTEGLLEVTGRWPLLLRLVNKILVDYASMAPDVSAKGDELRERLRTEGPAAIDNVTGAVGRGLNVGQSQDRALAIGATIAASTSLLDQQEADRFAELGVFAEDAIIPFSLVARLWRASAGVRDLEAAQVVKRLAGLALVSEVSELGGGITLHDVIRDFVRDQLGQRLTGLGQMLIDAVAADLPAATPLGSEITSVAQVAWWRLEHDQGYMSDHLIEHLLAAGRQKGGRRYRR